MKKDGKPVFQLLINDFSVLEQQTEIFSFDNFLVLYHAPYNFTLKSKTSEAVNFLLKQKEEQDFYFIIHYTAPYDEFVVLLNLFLKKISDESRLKEKILIENSAYYTLTNEQFEGLPLDFCLDTCHLFASGIELKPFLQSFQKRIKAIHLNDYADAFGTKKDRHANIFSGNVFSSLSNKKLLFDTILSGAWPVVLETPDQTVDYDRLIEKLEKRRRRRRTSSLSFLGMTFTVLSQTTKENKNEKITSFIEKEIETKKKKDIFGKKALERGVYIISSLPFEITNSSQLDGIGGIGDGIKKRVDEALLLLVEKNKTVISYDAKKQKEEKRIERAFIKENFEKTFKKIGGIITGSYRRGQPDSGDVDVLVVDTTIAETIDFIRQNYELKKIVSSGDKKATVIVTVKKSDVQLDVVVTSSEDKAAALLYFTGSKYFNIEMRKKAKELGYKLNEYGLFTVDGEKIKTRTEKGIFDVLGLEYKKPYLRL